jgi:hypothetical protein
VPGDQRVGGNGVQLACHRMRTGSRTALRYFVGLSAMAPTRAPLCEGGSSTVLRITADCVADYSILCFTYGEVCNSNLSWFEEEIRGLNARCRQLTPVNLRW